MTPSDESQHSDVTAGTVRTYKVRRGGNPSRENSLRRTANRTEDPLFSYPEDFQLDEPILLNGEEAESCPDGSLAQMKKNTNDEGSSYDSLVEDFFENAIKNAEKGKQEGGRVPSGKSEQSAPSAEGDGGSEEDAKAKEDKKDSQKISIKKEVIQWNSEMLRRNLNKPRMPLMRRKKKSMHMVTRKKKKNDAKGKSAKMTSQAKHANEWNSYQNDLDKYRLTKEELEQKRNSLKSKNLDKVKVEYQQRLQRMRTGKNNDPPARKSAPATSDTTRGITRPTTVIGSATTATGTAPPNGVHIKSNEEPTLNECDPRREGTHRCCSDQRSRKKNHSKLKQTSTDKVHKRMKERGGHSLSDVNNNHLGSPYSDAGPSYMYSNEGKYPSLNLIHSDGSSSGGQYTEWGKQNRRVTQQKDRHPPNGRYHIGENKQRNKRTHLDKWSSPNESHRSGQFRENPPFRGDHLGSSGEYSSLLSVLSSECEFDVFSSHSMRRKGKNAPQEGTNKWRDKWYANHEAEPPSWAKKKRTRKHFYSHNNRSDSDRMTISTDRSASTGESTMDYFTQELKKRNEVLSPVMDRINIRTDPLEDLAPVGRKEFIEKKFYPNLGIKLFPQEGYMSTHSNSSPSSGVSSASTTHVDHLWDSDYTDEIEKLRCTPQMDQDILRLKKVKLETFNCIKKMVQSVRTFICEGDLEEAPSIGEKASPRGAHRMVERMGDNPLMELLFRENEKVYTDTQSSRIQQEGYTNEEPEEHYEGPKSIHSEYSNYVYLDQLHQGDDMSISTPLSSHKMEVALHQDHLRDVPAGVSSNSRGHLSRLDLTGSDFQNEGGLDDEVAFVPQGSSPRGWKGHQVGKTTPETDTATANMTTADLHDGEKLRRPDSATRASKKGPLMKPRSDAKQSQRVPNKKESNQSVESISSTSKGSRQGTLKTKVHSGVDARNASQPTRNSTRKEKNTFNETRTLLRGKVKGEAKGAKLAPRRKVSGVHATGGTTNGAVKDVMANTTADSRNQRLISQKILNTSINFDETQNLSDEDQFIFDTYLNEVADKREDNLEDIIRNQVALFERDFL
ncbi:Uncharacterized protein PCOAH_00016530 [Plasmodium coatneyi]|uniref:Uncharacterized protein n=1 Tax=Plasmodium coatneyi TaxID=208452 RepID=A0A1B1DX36_9APIC|nr:Uncharacterized protein PCOAH_00016530 [Plasmodium coatneyi]ANQ07300.1 Uncharacterized protein PCOAH_00016530 [Plasmodium coatneyi]